LDTVRQSDTHLRTRILKGRENYKQTAPTARKRVQEYVKKTGDFEEEKTKNSAIYLLSRERRLRIAVLRYLRFA